MSEVAGTLIDTILQRIRDPQGSAHSRDLVRSLLSHSQRMVNARTKSVLETLALTTDPNRLFYPIAALVPNAIRVEAVRSEGRDLSKCDWRSYQFVDAGWFRAVSDRFETWSLVGRDLLVIYPAKAITSSVDVVYSKLTNDLVAEDTATEIPDDDLPAVVDLMEAILLAKQRTFEPATEAVKRLVNRLEMVVNRGKG